MWGLPPQNLSSPLYTTCDLSKTNSVDQNDLKKKKKRFPIILSIELKKKKWWVLVKSTDKISNSYIWADA